METWEYNYIRREVMKLTGLDIANYKGAQMERRLRAYLSRSGHANWPALFKTLNADPAGEVKLRDALTINVSAFFRDIDKYQALRTQVLPSLFDQRRGLRIWSAGCSYGQEAYTLAMILAEDGRPLQRHTIIATDIDNGALTAAQAGGPYTAEDVAAVPAATLARYFRPDGGRYWVKEELRRTITFKHHDLLSGVMEERFDLIVCRNVVIYFTMEAKEQLYRRFHAALNPGGILFVGATEVLTRAAALGFEPTGLSFYRAISSTTPEQPRGSEPRPFANRRTGR